ncbi:hypothetical protein B0H34DRAFT_724969 [Crassisporium funariophilum]|nr:hypothetical protein B0H34DRAFT_724969 [Crassisporium funariophilum]
MQTPVNTPHALIKSRNVLRVLRKSPAFLFLKIHSTPVKTHLYLDPSTMSMITSYIPLVSHASSECTCTACKCSNCTCGTPVLQASGGGCGSATCTCESCSCKAGECKC